jgi:hypothetical protein
MDRSLRGSRLLGSRFRSKLSPDQSPPVGPVGGDCVSVGDGGGTWFWNQSKHDGGVGSLDDVTTRGGTESVGWSNLDLGFSVGRGIGCTVRQKYASALYLDPVSRPPSWGCEIFWAGRPKGSFMGGSPFVLALPMAA